mgnify:CR=1
MAKVLGSGSKSGEVSCLEGLASWVSCELWFWTAREPRGERADHTSEGESLWRLWCLRQRQGSDPTVL